MKKTTKTAVMTALAFLPAVSPASAQDVPPARERMELEAALARARVAAARVEAAVERHRGAVELQVRRGIEARAAMEAEVRAARAVLPTSAVPEPWLQEDPGAELYQEARAALNDGRHRRAAQLLARLREDHPGSGYVPDSFYWEAFARHRMGGRGSYRTALELLARQASDHPDARTRADADELRVRIEAELAQRGDAEAAEAVARQAADPCGEDQSLRGAALSALLHMNAEQALPILREVLRSRDECSVELRRRAVFLVSQQMTEESVDILLDLAHRNPDPDPEVREQAVFWLSQVRSDEALEALASVLRETDDPELQERAVFALSQHGSERAVELLRSYAERPDADPEIRAHAIFWIGEAGHAAGTSYLRELYPRLEDPELKERVVFGVGRNADPESRAWLLERAGDPSEEMELRKNALFWAGQSGAVDAGDLRRLLASFDDPEMREQLVFVASRSDDSEAVEFLMEVAASGGDPELREKAIFWLGQSEDPRVAEFLLDLLRR